MSINIEAAEVSGHGGVPLPAIGVENVGNSNTTNIVLTFETDSTLVNPTLTNETTNVSVTYNGTITAPESIVVNVKERKATRTSDGANMTTLITWSGSKWYMELAPGHNQLKLTGSGSGRCSVQHRSARYF